MLIKKFGGNCSLENRIEMGPIRETLKKRYEPYINRPGEVYGENLRHIEEFIRSSVEVSKDWTEVKDGEKGEMTVEKLVYKIIYTDLKFLDEFDHWIARYK